MNSICKQCNEPILTQSDFVFINRPFIGLTPVHSSCAIETGKKMQTLQKVISLRKLTVVAVLVFALMAAFFAYRLFLYRWERWHLVIALSSFATLVHSFRIYQMTAFINHARTLDE